MITVTTTSGVKFRLLKKRMTSMHEKVEELQHWAYRKDVRATFKTGARLPTAGPYCPGESPSEYWGGTVGWEVARHSTYINIGCMRFNGASYRTLRKWALST